MSAKRELERRAAHARRQKPRLVERWWFWGGIGVLILILVPVGWIGMLALQAKSDLEAAVPLVSTLKTQILAQDMTGATATFEEIKPRVAGARTLTSDPVWRLGEGIPGLGPNLRAVRELAAVTSDVVTGALDPLMTVAGSVSLASFKPVNGAIDVKPILAATPSVDAAAVALDRAAKSAAAIKTDGAVGQVVQAADELTAMLAKVAPQLDQARDLIHVLPGVLGNDGARNYLVIFQNNGELLARGGTTGSLALLHVDHGKVSLQKQSSASIAVFPRFSKPVVILPAELKPLYPHGLGTQVQDLTQTPRFSMSFDLAQAMWKKAKGDKIDGLMAIDTVALSYIVNATGPIKLIDGTQLTAANTVSTLLGGLYTKHSPAYIDKIYETMAGDTFKKVTSGQADTATLIAAVLKAASEKRVLMWTPRPDEQKLIKESPFYGAPPVSTAKTDGIGVYYRDETPSKLESYMKPAVQLAQASCPADGKVHLRVTVALTNAAPKSVLSLPAYITGGGSITPVGDIRVAVNVYAPPGYTITGMTVDGKPSEKVTYGGGRIEQAIGTDGEYPVSQLQLLVKRTKTKTLTVDMVAGHADLRALTTDITPTVHPTVVTTTKLDCSTVTVG